MSIKITRRAIFGGATIFESLSAETISQAIKEMGHKPNLTGANLVGADLTKADLTGAYLSRADLTGADLGGTNLTKADLVGAELYGANLTGANLTEANLFRADLVGAELFIADLTKADLVGADLGGANLFRADLFRADLHRASLVGADLTGANLYGADLSRADLRGTNLTKAALPWQSHGCISELLRRKAGEDIQKRMVAGLILVSRDWCWDKFLSLELTLEIRDWALTTLSAWAWAGDSNVPTLLTEWMESKGIERPVRPDVETKGESEDKP